MKTKVTVKLLLPACLLATTLALSPTALQAVVAPVDTAEDPQIIERLPAEARERVRERAQEIPDEVGEQVRERTEKREEASIQIQEQAQQGLETTKARVGQAHAGRLQRRFTFYERRVNTLAFKLQTRLNTLQDQGFDVSEAQVALDEALQKIEVGMTQAQEAITQFEQLDMERDPQEISTKARALAQQARTEFQVAVQLMKNAVRSTMAAQQQ